MKIKMIISILFFCTIAVPTFSQTFTGFTVQKTDKNGILKPIQSINQIGYVNIDTLKKQVTIATTNGEIIIEGHSMKKLSDSKFRFHKYNKENSDFEIEILPNSLVLYTHLALLHDGFRYKTVFQTDYSPLLSDRR